MPPSQQAVRLEVNSTTVPIPEGLLHEGIFRMSLQQPQALAVIDSRYQWCYGELAEKARRGAAYLTEHGVQPGDNVAVSMSKGAEQFMFPSHWINPLRGENASTQTPTFSGYWFASTITLARQMMY